MVQHSPASSPEPAGQTPQLLFSHQRQGSGLATCVYIFVEWNQIAALSAASARSHGLKRIESDPERIITLNP